MRIALLGKTTEGNRLMNTMENMFVVNMDGFRYIANISDSEMEGLTVGNFEESFKFELVLMF